MIRKNWGGKRGNQRWEPLKDTGLCLPSPTATHTYKAQAHFGLPDGGAAAHQAENEHHDADADDDGRGDQSVSVLDEAVEVVIALDHVGSDVGQGRPCSLWGEQAPRRGPDYLYARGNEELPGSFVREDVF